MLGFSLPKLIILCLIIVVIWYGFKIFGRGRAISKRNGSIEENNPQNPDAVDMIRCDICGDYFVPINSKTSCSKCV